MKTKMSKIEQHRKLWQGKSDEWMYERLALELTQKVEEIHKLLAENKQLRLELNQTKTNRDENNRKTKRR